MRVAKTVGRYRHVVLLLLLLLLLSRSISSSNSIHSFYVVLFSALEQTHCAHVACDSE